MARYGISMEFEKGDLGRFNSACNASVRNLFRGTKKATTEGCREILTDAVRRIPKYTGTAADSAFMEVKRRSDTALSYWAYEGTVGFGGNGDPVNPITGEPASAYVVAVHENTHAVHPNGEAKFLENAVREYMSSNFRRAVEVNAKDALRRWSD